MKMVEAQYLNPLTNIPTFKILEGNKTRIVREDGSISVMKPKKIKTPISFNLRDMGQIHVNDIINIFDTAAIEIAKKKAKMVYDSISQSSEIAGTMVEGEISIENLLKEFEKVFIEFDDLNMPILPPIIAGTEAFIILQDILPELDSNETYAKRFKQIIEKKREEWSARESSRELVG